MNTNIATRRLPPKRAHVVVPERRAGVPADLVAIGMDVLGQWLHDARVGKRMTQAQLARIAGMHQTTLSRLERGRLQGLRLHRLAALIGALSCAAGEPLPRLVG